MKFQQGHMVYYWVGNIAVVALLLLAWWLPQWLLLLPWIERVLENRFGFWFHVYGSARIVLIVSTIWTILLYRHIVRNHTNIYDIINLFLFWIMVSLIVLLESLVCNPTIWSSGNSKELFMFESERVAELYVNFLVSISIILGFFGVTIDYSNSGFTFILQENYLSNLLLNIAWLVLMILMYYFINNFAFYKSKIQEKLRLFRKTFLVGRTILLGTIWLTNMVWLHYGGYQLDDFVVMGFMSLLLAGLSVPFTYLLIKVVSLFGASR